LQLLQGIFAIPDLLQIGVFVLLLKFDDVLCLPDLELQLNDLVLQLLLLGLELSHFEG